MYDYFFIHGTFGDPFNNWFPWLFKELKKKNKKVLVPQFPTPENQNYKNWENIFLEYAPYLDKKTTMVGHSIGATFLAKYNIKKIARFSG